MHHYGILMIADLALTRGKTVTVDPDESIAETVAVKHGRIIAVGSNSEVERLIGGTLESMTSGGTP